MRAGDSCQHPGVFSSQRWVAERVVTGGVYFSVPRPAVPPVPGLLCPGGCRLAGLPSPGMLRGAGAERRQHLSPTPRRSAPAGVIPCALLSPLRGLGTRRMALWASSESGSWREAEQRGRKTLAFHSSFSQFILRDQLHAIRQLGVLFSFQLCTVGEAGKVIFFFLVLLFHDAIVIALSKALFGEEGKLVNDAEGPCIVSALCSCSLGEALFTVQGVVSAEQLCCYFSKVV